MKERPIIFSDGLISKLLDGSKTQTRRVIKEQPSWDGPPQRMDDGSWLGCQDILACHGDYDPYDTVIEETYLDPCPYGAPGGRLWVRETWADVNTENGPALLYKADGCLHYCVDDAYPVEYERYPGCSFAMWWSDLLHRKERRCESDHSWRSPIHMPRWASRLTLEITDVRVERLNSISEEDAEAEGCEAVCHCGEEIETHRLGNNEHNFVPKMTAVDDFANLWNSIHGAGAWERNDWVWCLTFKRIV